MSKASGDIQAIFLDDVKDHTMEVVLNHELYRHLRFRGKTRAYWFDIITWPGCLCINGDMGCFAFSRLTDMFEFFRSDKRPNVSYWTQKVVAEDKYDGGTHEYCPAMFRSSVTLDLQLYLEDEPDDPELRRLVERDVLSRADDGKREAVEAAMEFTYKGKQIFPDFYEHKLERPATQYLWCLWAILWAIETYDKAKAGAVAHA